eukprot:SAG31_NODE_20921_length_562_cov_0.889849_1_plen_50_part_10
MTVQCHFLRTPDRRARTFWERVGEDRQLGKNPVDRHPRRDAEENEQDVSQ